MKIINIVNRTPPSLEGGMGDVLKSRFGNRSYSLRAFLALPPVSQFSSIPLCPPSPRGKILQKGGKNV